MTAHRVSEGGSFRIDRRFPGVGRIALATGTTSIKRFRAYDQMLTELHEDGKTAVLKAIRDRRVTLQEVYQAKRTGRLSYVASDLALFRPLWDAVDAWLPGSARAKSSRRRYSVSWKALRRSGALREGALVKDLASVDWKRLRASWDGGAADWNRMRAAVSRFLSMLLEDKYHPVRRQVMNAIPRAREPKGRVPDLTPAVFWSLVNKSPEHVRAAYVVLAGTGLRVGEYLALTEDHLLPHTRQIVVPGTKTESSEDVIRCGPELWEWVVAAVPPALAYRWTYRHFKRAAAAIGMPELTLHDLRHLKGQILSEAGLPEAQIATALRHADVRTTRRYTRQRDHGKAAEATDRALFEKREGA